MTDSHYADTSESITELEKQNSDTVRPIVGEGAVLLENNSILPLTKTGKIALYGNAARHTIKGGTGSGCVNSRIVVNIESGLENEGFIITPIKNCASYCVEHSRWILEKGTYIVRVGNSFKYQRIKH